MHDRLNFFEPWEGIPAYHENQLTRALLVVLRCCPIAHQAWLSLVDPKLMLHSLPRPSFDTQRGTILNDEVQATVEEPIKGISVLCSADIPNDASGVVLGSDRRQILDGIIRYGDEIVIVLESKLDGPADERQAGHINLHGQPVAFHDPIRKISWRDVVGTFTDLADEKRGLISAAEQVILSDFLDLINVNFSQLGPFNTLRRCKMVSSRISRRLRTILSEVLGNDDGALPGTRAAIKTAYLGYKDADQKDTNRQVELTMYPADTLVQARALYARPNVVERLRTLEHEDWHIWPNFHFGFMAKGFCWTTRTISLDQYMSYWEKNIGNTEQIPRHEWDKFWETLVETGIANSADRKQFDLDFTNTGRQSASPRPGLACEFIWSLEEAERLDARPGQLVKSVRERINRLLEAIGEDKIEAA
jgi:hypothetical protein